MTRQTTAGTASAGFRCDPEPHTFRADPRTDPGERPRCLCGAERAEHLPTPREA